MDFSKSLIAFSLTNFVVFSLASVVPGGYFVFGNVITPPVTAVIYTSVLIALVICLVNKASEMYKLKYSEAVWMLIYLGVNVLTLYLLARTQVSEVVAVGVDSYWVAIAVGAAANVAQYATWKTFLETKKK